MATAGELTIILSAKDEFSAHLRGLNQDLQRLDKQVESTGGGLSRLGQIGLAGAGIGVIVSGFQSALDAVGGLVTQASDLNEQLSRSEQIFGAAAESVQRFARESGQSLGIARAEALQMAGNFGQLLRTSGLTEDAAADMSQQLLRLGADLASFNNLEVGDALNKLRSGLTGEAEPLRELGVLLSEDAVQAEALASGLAASTKELTEADKVQARYNLILKQTATAQGDFARTSTGLANAQRIIKASWADLSATLGQAFLPVVARAASFLATELPRALALVERATEALGPALAALFSGDLQGALDRAVALVGAAAAALAPRLAEWTRAFLDWAGVMAPRLLQALSERLGDLWAWLRETAPGLLETAVGTWVPAFLTWVAEVGPKVLAALIQLLSKLGAWIKATGAPQLAAFGQDLGEALVRGFAKALEQLGPALAGAVRAALAERPDLAAFLGGALPAVSPAGAALPRVVGSAAALAGPAGRVHVEIHGMDIVVGVDAREAARAAGQEVETRVYAALTQSAAATDPGAPPALQGAGR